LADEAVEIGPGPATDSYLRGDRIIAAAKEYRRRRHPSGATASWPRMPISPRPWDGPASSSSALARRHAPAWAARRRQGDCRQGGRTGGAGYGGESQESKALAAEAQRVGYP